MKTFNEALKAWEAQDYGWTLEPMPDIQVVVEPLLFGQYFVAVYRDGELVGEKVPVYPGGGSDHDLFPDDEIPRRPGVKSTTLTVRLEVNTETYGSVESIVKEVAESLLWMACDHDAILTGVWEVEE